MLIAGIFGNWLNSMFHTILLLIDSVVYWAVAVCYKLFMALASASIFKEEFFTNFAQRIYAILGVFMLFYLAYALLNAIVDPDKLTKGDKSVSKTAMNLVISLILLGLTPTIFSYAYRLQNYILSSNLIGAIILGTDVKSVKSTDDFGGELAFTVMNAFINPDNYNVNMSDAYYWEDNFKKDAVGNTNFTGLPGLAESIIKPTTDFKGDSEGTTVQVQYYPVISTAAGIFLIYTILSFTIDLGVRVFKFAFCQLLAPIPIVMRAMPGKKAQFDKWLKLTVTVYLEVFIRVGFMYLAVYFIRAIVDNVNFTEDLGLSGIMGMIALAVLIMGVFAFVKQAPKMLSEMLGIDSGNLKLGFGEKLKAGGAFVAGGMLGAGVTAGVNNLTRGIGLTANKWKSGNVGGAFGELARTFGSTAAGITSGGVNAFRNRKDATSFAGMRNAASKGVAASIQNRENRAAFYEANGGFRGGMQAHFDNGMDSFAQWAGVGTGLDTWKRYQTQVQSVKDARKAVDDRLTAILNRDKNKMEARNTYSVAGVGNFTNYANLLNEMDIMKSTGKTSRGANVTAQMLTEMAKQEYNMKEDMKKDILDGYDLAGGLGQKYTSADFKTKYDAELKELVTSYRTKALQNASVIKNNSDNVAANAEYLKAAVEAQDKDLASFVLGDDALKLYKDGNDAIKSATNRVNVEVASRIEKAQQKKS